MASTTPTEFLSFPKLPPELREMVWDEASQLPTLDIQRFNAEIAPHPEFPKSLKSRDLVLCLNPIDDFIQLTSGYVGLLGACRESRWAASAKIKGYLPINYLARDADGSAAVRFARVPFNPDGHVCIGGLGPALRDAARGLGARATAAARVLHDNIQCLTFPEIENLTLVITHRDIVGMQGLELEMAFDVMTRKMAKLKTVALVDEGWMNERHQIDAKDFKWLHKPAPVDRPPIPWLDLFRYFTSCLNRFNVLKQFRAGQVAAGAR